MSLSSRKGPFAGSTSWVAPAVVPCSLNAPSLAPSGFSHNLTPNSHKDNTFTFPPRPITKLPHRRPRSRPVCRQHQLHRSNMTPSDMATSDMAPSGMAPSGMAPINTAPVIMPQASQTQSCPLLKLPPEVRSRIYAYTHSLSLDLDLTGDGCDNLSKAWESTPLVTLAATCRLIADEARNYYRSLPAGNYTRRALVDLLPSGGPDSCVSIRLTRLPCPTIDLTHVAASYDFVSYISPTHDFPRTGGINKIEAILYMSFHVSSALRRLMTAASLRTATKLMCAILWIAGLPPRRDGESRFEAMRRILCKPRGESNIAEFLVQQIFSWISRDADMRQVTSDLELPALEGRLLCLLV